MNVGLDVFLWVRQNVRMGCRPEGGQRYTHTQCVTDLVFRVRDLGPLEQALRVHEGHEQSLVLWRLRVVQCSKNTASTQSALPARTAGRGLVLEGQG